MKLKCPGCAKLLQIPDSAAGKVVKCSCGKQLRVPAAKTAAPKAAAPKAAAPQRPAAARPAPAAPAAPMGGDEDFFNDLTETDLAPVKAVHQPGVKAATPSAGPSGMYLDGETGGGNQVPRPILMYLGAVYSFLTAAGFSLVMLALFGILGIFAAAAGPENEGSAEQKAAFATIAAMGTIAAVPLGFKIVIEIAAGACCFLRGKGPYATIVFTYAFSAALASALAITHLVNGEFGPLVIWIPCDLLTIAFLVFMYFEKPRSYFGDSVKIKHAIIHTVLGIVGWAALYGALAFVLASRVPQ